MELVGLLLQSPAWTQVTAVGRREVVVSAAYQVFTDETWQNCRLNVKASLVTVARIPRHQIAFVLISHGNISKTLFHWALR